MLMINKLESTW